MLTGESDATRRLIWAVAVQLGHGSPLTTLETYAHGGHQLLRQWCNDVLWKPIAEVDAAEWMAWSTGSTLRTMQRHFQRRALKEAEKRLARALGQWSRVARLGTGPRVTRTPSLPPTRLVEEKNALVSADLIIDHARCFGRIDGLAERLFVSDHWVEAVLFAAQEFATRHRTKFTPADQWWIESADVRYPEHEVQAATEALMTLQELDQAEVSKLCRAIAPFFVPSARMVVVEEEATLLSAASLARRLVEDPQVVQLLVPAKLGKRLTPAERERRDSLARRRAELKGVPHKPVKPRLVHRDGIEFEGSDHLVNRARQLGLSIALHGRTAGAREGVHDWRRPGARLAVRIKENGYDKIRSAKVLGRVLASAIISCAAEASGVQSGA